MERRLRPDHIAHKSSLSIPICLSSVTSQNILENVICLLFLPGVVVLQAGGFFFCFFLTFGRV